MLDEDADLIFGLRGSGNDDSVGLRVGNEQGLADGNGGWQRLSIAGAAACSATGTAARNPTTTTATTTTCCSGSPNKTRASTATSTNRGLTLVGSSTLNTATGSSVTWAGPITGTDAINFAYQVNTPMGAVPVPSIELCVTDGLRMG